MMKISKSKRQLAQMLIEAGVKKFPDGADWAAQGSLDIKVSFYVGYKPNRRFGEAAFCGGYCGSRYDVQLPSLINNWHQTILSRAEFDQIVAETAPDADGWIEWKGGECPVGEGDRIDVKFSDGDEFFDVSSYWGWGADAGCCNIIAYRPHKPEQVETVEYNHSGVVYTGPVKSEFVVDEKSTLDQLLQGWHNADDFAKRKQAEADEAAAMRDERWEAVQDRAGEMGVTVGFVVSVAHNNPELVITYWRDLRVGDEIEVFNFEYPEIESRRKQELMSGPCVVMQAEGGNVRIELKKNLPTKGSHWNATGVDACEFKFIRRP